jgi:hypothetical protein
VTLDELHFIRVVGQCLSEETFRTELSGSPAWIRVTIHGSETSNQIDLFLFCDAISARVNSEPKRLK